MDERWGKDMESRRKGGKKTFPEGVVLVTSQIHVPGVQKTSSQRNSPLTPPN